MQSRRDQVQAYFFVVGRMVAAVTHGRPDVLQAPNRRLTTGTALGVLVAALLVGIFGIIGLFFPGGNTTWRQPGTIVMDDASGARFLYLDGQLRPVLNYSSARLASGSGGPLVSVSMGSLGGTPVGQPIGIPGAPDSLPAADDLDAGPWTVCVQAGADPATTGRSVVTLLLGRPAATPLAAGEALVVSTPDAAVHVVWDGRRHRVTSRTALEALGYGGVAPFPVSAAWLTPIPSGRDLTVPEVDGIGAPGPPVDGRPSLVGQVFTVRNPAVDSDQLYLLRDDGVTALSPTTAAMVLASEATRAAYPGRGVVPIEVGPGALVDVPRSAGPDLVDGLPAQPPDVRVPRREEVPCARFDRASSGEMEPVLELRRDTDVADGSVPVAEHTSGTMADRLVLPAGSGVLAGDLRAPGIRGTTYLVTDVGIRFPIPTDEVAAALGYSSSAAVPVPAALLDLLPVGPVLDPAGALRTQVP